MLEAKVTVRFVGELRPDAHGRPDGVAEQVVGLPVPEQVVLATIDHERAGGALGRSRA